MTNLKTTAHHNCRDFVLLLPCNEYFTVLAVKYSFQKFVRGVPSTLLDQINGFVINQTKEFHPFASRVGKEELQEIGESGM
jgi:hypothetical protein